MAGAVDRLRNASTKGEALGASAGLDVGAINVALANQPDRLLQPLRLAGTVDAMRVAMLRFTITQAQVDADDAVADDRLCARRGFRQRSGGRSC